MVIGCWVGPSEGWIVGKWGGGKRASGAAYFSPAVHIYAAAMVNSHAVKVMFFLARRCLL